MTYSRLTIRRIDSRRDDIRAAMLDLRRRLSPRGNVVSEAGRQRTIEVFGEPLTPAAGRRAHLRRRAAARDWRPCSIIPRGSTRPCSRPKRSAYPRRNWPQPTPRPIRGCWKPCAAWRKTSASFRRRFCTATFGWSGRADIWPNAIGRLDRVGICVPGGAAAYPSTVLMTAVPAQVAGVKQLAVVAPPTKFGAYNADMLATCRELGISEVYRLGGAQAVAAMAYGIEGLPRVDKIVGPGNLFVALAKQHVFGDVDIDSIAGPSEVVVIVDESTRPEFTAIDLIAQAEHAPGASVLIGWNEKVLEAAVAELSRQLDRLDRGDLARQSLEEFGAVILARDADEACALADEIAPEHLHIATQDAERLAEKIRHAGAMFLGNYTPVALGDYAAGPSHVLPTSGTARFASGLSANDFLRTNSILHFNQDGLMRLAPDVQVLATKEGLTGHRASVEVRMK